jgi:hypothetical protein
MSIKNSKWYHIKFDKNFRLTADLPCKGKDYIAAVGAEFQKLLFNSGSNNGRSR